MPKHVRMDFHIEAGDSRGPVHHRLKTALGERRTPLANEYKRRLRHLLAQQLTESPQLPAGQGVGRRCALFDSTHVQDSVF